ncbi:MAG TPA: hypothetical protein VHO25_02630, partial [Polyangiaceae bacterium]|nr:hypothetical protein [Polyangiaceae bacterium]
DGADFWSQIWSKFDGPHPELVDVHVEFDGTELLALGFACDRVPYVIKTGGESPRFEVPWREGTRVDTATRSQLLRMMVPLRDAPTVEVRQHVATSDTVLTITFLVIPANSEPVALPIHHAVLECGGEEIKAEDVHGNNSALSQPHPVLREAKGQGVYFYGPAEIVVRWRLPQHRPPQQCRVRLGFEPGAISVVVTDGVPSR